MVFVCFCLRFNQTGYLSFPPQEDNIYIYTYREREKGHVKSVEFHALTLRFPPKSKMDCRYRLFTKVDQRS